jgi:hypothetical protein
MHNRSSEIKGEFALHLPLAFTTHAVIIVLFYCETSMVDPLPSRTFSLISDLYISDIKLLFSHDFTE